MATWRSGYAPDCKSVYPGSIPGVASKKIPISPDIDRFGSRSGGMQKRMTADSRRFHDHPVKPEARTGGSRVALRAGAAFMAFVARIAPHAMPKSKNR